MSDALAYLVKARPDAVGHYFQFLKECGKHLDPKTRDLISVITKVQAAVKRQIIDPERKKVPFGGLYTEPDTLLIYPAKDVAANLLGFLAKIAKSTFEEGATLDECFDHPKAAFLTIDNVCGLTQYRQQEILFNENPPERLVSYAQPKNIRYGGGRNG